MSSPIRRDHYRWFRMEELLGRLNAEDFASRRLIVILKDEQKLRKSDEVINNYDDLYVIDYETVEECMAAYAYYAEIAEAVEPDAFMEIASDGSEEALSEKEGASVRPDGVTRVIALLDTGASASGAGTSGVRTAGDYNRGHPGTGDGCYGSNSGRSVRSNQ